MKGNYRTGDQMLVREINLSTVLHCLKTRAPLSRARVADLTGLNKTTVSSLVEELVDRGLIHEVGRDTSGSGRPATLLDLNPEAGHIIGVALGVDFASVILTDFVGQIHWRCLQETDPADGQETILSQVKTLIDQAVSANKNSGARLLGLGLATPGTVDIEQGLLIFSPNLQWHNVRFRQIFSLHTGLPVIVDNDANAAALAEHHFGAAQDMQNFVFIFGGVGVGGGLFLNGELYRGYGGFAGEIGHTNFIMESYRPPCRCGNRGCWETYTNQYAILERMRARLEVRRNSLVSSLMREQRAPLSLALIAQAAKANDAEALEVLQETGSLLGLGVANLINIFNPQRVIIGGALSTVGPYMLPAIQEAVKKTALPEIHQQAQIAFSAFGPDASVMGAVALVVEDILSVPTQVKRLSEPA